MRLFVALVPPAAILDEIESAIAAAQPVEPGLRWARREQWHLTLAFLGEVDEATVGDLRKRLARAADRHRPVALSFAGAGRFDGRVLWTRVGGERERLVRLAATVSAAARRTGIAQEQRTFRPHLTLARAREPMDLRPAAAALADFTGSPWTAADIHLVRSRLGRVPAYETLHTWPLTGRRGRPDTS